MTLNYLLKKIRKLFSFSNSIPHDIHYVPNYRLIEILKNEEDNYEIGIQIINKNKKFYATPEDILSDDKLIDQFSPRDVRTITYLGYLGIHSPQYKILAQRFVKNNKIVFLLKQKNNKDIIVQTASEIIQNGNIIVNMPSADAQTIGYVLAHDHMAKEHNEQRIPQKKL